MEKQGEKIKFVFFDEFSCSTRPNTSYAWAIKNTRPKVKSNERVRKRLNGLLAVDTEGKEFLKLTPKAKTQDISNYFFDLVKNNLKYDRIWIVLDNNSTHKNKMKRLLKEELANFYQKQNISKLPIIEFDYTPAYSPDHNLAEYLIRIIRQILLHHLPINTSLEEIERRFYDYFDKNQLQTPEQIQNILNHILTLVVGRE